jgi:hypothetical protein
MANAPYVYWNGMTTAPDLSEEDFKKFNDFYSNVHIHEVVERTQGGVRGTRYELSEKDPRNNLGPQWLAMYELDSQKAADDYIAADKAGTRPRYTPGLNIGRQLPDRKWRLIWKRINPVEGELGAHRAPYLQFNGISPAPGSDEKGIKEFNDFYNQIHLPEVMGKNGYMRGTRYELYHEFVHEAPGCPTYLAVYEGDEETMGPNRSRENKGKSTSGPPSWENRTTLWRLKYKLVHTWAPGE